jgi:voltage-gated potassium channel
MAVTRQRIYAIIESADADDDASRRADIGIMSLIVLNVLAVVLESVSSISNAYSAEFYWFEAFSVTVFSIEYILRLWSCEDPALIGSGMTLKARLRYAFSFHGVIDLVAILPFYLGMFINADLRFLRALRLIRILKLTRYSPALTLLIRALKREQQAITASLFLMAIALIVASCGIYACERGAQSEDFGSIPAAIWWAIATLTTVGYGDVIPVTVGGKVFGACVMLVGVVMVALPTGILASTFADELRARRESYRDVVDSALDDGVITEQEATSLETFRARTGLSPAEAERILHDEHARKLKQIGPCPSCGYEPT